jgi:ADP-heptose:LPS heptosyltransferase
MDKTLIYLRCDAIGDAILAGGMLAPIRRAFGGHQIIVICQEGVSAIYSKCPWVDRIIPFDKKRMYTEPAYRDDFFRQMRELRAAVAVNTVYSRDEMGDFLMAATGAAMRVGHRGDCSNLPEKKRDANSVAYTHLVTTEDGPRHELQRHIEFLNALGIRGQILIPQIWTDEKDQQFAREIFDQNQLASQGKIIAFSGGARSLLRQYSRLGMALQPIAAAGGIFLIGLGSAEEWEMNERHLQASGAPYLNLSGKADILQSAEIVRKCSLAYGCESGWAQIACAVDTPNVVVQGGGFFGRFLPYSELTTVVCLPLDCFGCASYCKFSQPHCVTGINVVVVSAALRIAIDQGSQGYPRIIVQNAEMFAAPPGGPAWSWRGDLISGQANVIRVQR